MRLICPNCSAQYEIDAELVPDDGRDVQCSNCGHTWFELPPAPDAPTEPDAPESEDPAGDQDESPDDAPSHAALAIAAASEDSEEDDALYQNEQAETQPDPEPSSDPSTPVPPPFPPAQQRRPADAAALDILKEEAEREMSKRRAPPSESIETQADLGLEEIRNRKTPSRALRARIAAQDDSDATKARPTSESGHVKSQAEVISESGDQSPRRDLLPDIDEINSTLKSTGKKGGAKAQASAKHQKGFRAGFLVMALLAIVLILIYAQAPAIARTFPGSESALIPYLEGANTLRDWVDGLFAGS